MHVINYNSTVGLHKHQRGKRFVYWLLITSKYLVQVNLSFILLRLHVNTKDHY